MIIHVSDDFDLDKIADSGQCFRWEKMDQGNYRILAGKSCLYIRKLNEDRYELQCPQEEYLSIWQKYFDMNESYRDIRLRIDPMADPFLRQAAECEKGIRILRQDPWEMLVSFIISQNKNIPAIRKSIELLAECCGEKKTDVRGLSYYAFPDPAAVADLTQDKLMACKLGYRWKYVHAAAEAAAAGSLDLDRLTKVDEAVALEMLTGLYGVGIKVASCVALFGLHHIDAFPVDVWMKRILTEQYPDGYPYEKYKPYNGIYQQYMFAYYRHKT